MHWVWNCIFCRTHRVSTLEFPSFSSSLFFLPFKCDLFLPPLRGFFLLQFHLFLPPTQPLLLMDMLVVDMVDNGHGHRGHGHGEQQHSGHKHGGHGQGHKHGLCVGLGGNLHTWCVHLSQDLQLVFIFTG